MIYVCVVCLPRFMSLGEITVMKLATRKCTADAVVVWSSGPGANVHEKTECNS